MAVKHTPRYKWSSPQDWLGDKINDLLATAHAESLTDRQYRAIAEIATIANTIVNGTLNVDSDSVQDAFQDDMDDAGYFIDLDKSIPVLYELEPHGVNSALEANGTVHFFCSELCRDRFETDMPTDKGLLTASSPEVEDGTVCDQCGERVA